MRLVVVTSHPIQYQAPLFRELSRRVDLTVLFAHRASGRDQARAGFGVDFEWDIDLLSGYAHAFLQNISRQPDPGRFEGCDTPSVGSDLARYRPHAVLVMGWHLKSYIQTVWSAKRLGMPVMVRGDSQLATPRSPLKIMTKEITYPLLLRTFDAALYVGERSRRYYQHYHYPSRRQFFSPHCVDVSAFASRATLQARRDMRAKLRIEENVPVVLLAGKLLALKRPMDVIAACGLLRQQNIGAHLLVAGAGELSRDMIEAAMRQQVPMHMLGFQNQTEMPAVYAASDVMVLASESETWGLVCNEAIACRVPIVVSDSVGCAPDLAGDGTVGRAYRTGDVTELARALRAMLATKPTDQAFALKSAAYSPSAAAVGVDRALTFVSQRDSVGVR